jgi:hypothetical protein
MKFNAQDSRVIIVVVQVGAVENIRSSSGGAQEKGKPQDSMKLSLPQTKNGCISEFHPA